MGLGCMFKHLMHGGHSHPRHQQDEYDHHNQNHHHGHNHLSNNPMDVLKLRYAKGEINEEEYIRMKQILSNS